MTPRELAALASAAPSVKAVVVGDLMLDETWLGEVSRVAPEAPVPLLALSSMSRRAGGAGNVVENLAALGARTVAVGAVGPEEEGAWLARHLGAQIVRSNRDEVGRRDNLLAGGAGLADLTNVFKALPRRVEKRSIGG